MAAFEDFIAMFAEPDAWIFAAMIGVAYCAGWLTGDACGFNRGVKSMVTFVASLNRRQAPPRAESALGRPRAITSCRFATWPSTTAGDEERK
jgi:hypothetical protein